MGLGGQRHAPAALPRGLTRFPGYSLRPVWTDENLASPPGFDPRTVQPVASCYTVYAVSAHKLNYVQCIKYSARTEQQTHSVSVIKVDQFMV